MYRDEIQLKQQWTWSIIPHQMFLRIFLLIWVRLNNGNGVPQGLNTHVYIRKKRNVVKSNRSEILLIDVLLPRIVDLYSKPT